MPVVINEFEIVTEQAAPAVPVVEDQKPPASTAQSRAQETERLIRRQQERRARLHAH